MALPPTDAPFIGWDWDVVHDADMNDALPPLHYNGEPIDLTGCIIEVYIRPSYDFATSIAILTSDGVTPDITIYNAALGLATVFVAKGIVDNWPAGTFVFFVRVIDGDDNIAEVARGPFRIHAGDITAPPP